ncbi:hydrogenase 4 subunit F [Alicyclobacillus fastidiosus]|uniref:Hydrogenase 4 subunit F n=1 Tax=Alicyclobacillus fastidiosus TaxID=392011 RepID=A0ABV5AHZ2_9BACL|nr:hydrogenase 4 subunit F [Alicyclobacillus fastidiosus]WEH10080.1 hydrogenase 4 subunit F [Alicyclobacillus fastidiosus]
MALLAVMVPTVTGILSFIISPARLREFIHLVGSIATSLIGLMLVWEVAKNGSITSQNQFFHVDALSAVILMIISIVSLTTSIHSVGYIRHEQQEGLLSGRQTRQYYMFYHLFIATMVLVTVVNNMGLLWVGIEATTVVSAFLVAIYKKGEALEATWKYLMICSAGIALALLGVIILYASSIAKLGASNQVLNWTVLSNANLMLQPNLVALSFVFIMVGFGTKVGLAPMHFWLPDAHSQAPSPVSALLSGVLLNCAMLGLIRFGIVAENTLHGQLIQHLFIGFGLLSVILAFPFILVQRDFKRMLAYSTVEHMGIIAVALGIGGALGYTAALLQMFNHSIGKSMLFLSAGNVNQKYRSKQMPRVLAMLRIMPFTGVVFLVGTLAITGVPPFNIFTSEFSIFVAGFQQGHAVATSVLILFIAFIFAAMMFQVMKMIFGEEVGERVTRGEVSRWSVIPLVLPMAFVVAYGLYIPASFTQLIHHASYILAGGGHV